MYVTLRTKKTKELMNSTINDEVLEMIGGNGTDKVFEVFTDKLTGTSLKN